MYTLKQWHGYGRDNKGTYLWQLFVCLFVFEAKFKGLVMELCEELTMAPKFLPGMMEGIAMPFPKKLNLERVTMI